MDERKKGWYDQIQEGGYKIFENEPDTEEAIFESTEKLCNLIEKGNFENIVFIDASARPFAYALTVYWQSVNKGKRLPNIYFINPDGFHSKSKSERIYDVDDLQSKIPVPTELAQLAVDKATYVDTTDRLREVHKSLDENKDKPTLVVDTCLHTGSSARTTATALTQLGVKNLKIVSAIDDPKATISPADFYLLDYVPRRNCYTFGPEGLVDKGEDVVSVPHTYPNAIATGRQLREEIRQIIESRLPKAEQ